MEANLTLAQLAPFGLNEKQRGLLLADHRTLADTHLASPGSNIVGVGITRNPSPNSLSDSVALLVLLKHDEPKASSLYGDRTPNGVKILYQVTGEIKLLNRAHEVACLEQDAPLQAPVFPGESRPVRGGSSVAPDGLGYSGTAGCVLTFDSKDYMLSNNHVLANINRVAIDTAITQPSREDGGPTVGKVAKLKAFVEMVPTDKVPAVKNVADAAIAQYDSNDLCSPEMKKTSTVNYSLKAPVVAPVIDTAVQKSGRTTGYTTGKITAFGIEHTAAGSDGKQYKFKDVIQITGSALSPFALGGDSGSVISTVADNNPVGLLFSGGGTIFYANPMTEVLKALKDATGKEFAIKY